MRLKILVASMFLLSSRAFAAPLTPDTPAYWQTTEYAASRVLPSINASSAYARGYTGKGSTIAIIDSGIDLNSKEFTGRIKLTKDFTGTGIQDTIGHGTHVAGIAAAANNGTGVEGVAFDANLIVAKITNNGVANSASMIQGLSWAAANNATVANLSWSFGLPSNLSLTQLSPGVYSSNLSTSQLSLNAQQWAAAMPGQMIMVIAAGNDGKKTPGMQGSLATATDASGNLILGGRVIIAGNWNTITDKMDSTSNLSGTICSKVSGSVCQDKYTVSQFYLLAPGSQVISTVPSSINSSGLASMTGSSMSTAVISGAAAIIRQQWPQMSGANIVQLLLQTANKNIPGYNSATMGQGLLDLNKATQPFGNVGIPATGGSIISNPIVAPPPLLLVSGGSASTGKLSSVMLVDSLQRDFYAPAKAFTAVSNATEFNVRQTAMPYMSKNNYSLYNNYTDYQSVKFGEYEMSLYRDTTYNPTGTGNPVMFEVGYNKQYEDVNVKFTAGGFTENNTWLGNSIGAGNLNPSANQSYTMFTGVGADKMFETGTQVYANVTHGVTSTQASSSYITNIQPILSYSWNLGVEQKINEKHALGVMAYQPVTVYRAMADSNIPIGLDSNFNVITAGRINLAATITEFRLGAYYKLHEKNSTNIMAFVENRQNYKGQAGITDNAVGILGSYKF